MSDVHLYHCRHLPDELLLQAQKVGRRGSPDASIDIYKMPHVLAIIPHQTVICRHLLDILHLGKTSCETPGGAVGTPGNL